MIIVRLVSCIGRKVGRKQPSIAVRPAITPPRFFIVWVGKRPGVQGEGKWVVEVGGGAGIKVSLEL
jgi:hypothetical protein